MTEKVFLSIGSNLDPEKNIDQVKIYLDSNFKVSYSSIYKTPAEGFSGEDFLNLVCSFEPSLDPLELRANLKDQINLSFSNSINKRLNDNPLRSLAEGLADIVVDETLDVFLTPDGLGRLMDGEDPSSIIRNNKKSEIKDNDIEVLESIEFKYQSMNRFIVSINTINKKQIRLHLDRFGIRWKLVNVILP